MPAVGEAAPEEDAAGDQTCRGTLAMSLMLVLQSFSL